MRILVLISLLLAAAVGRAGDMPSPGRRTGQIQVANLPPGVDITTPQFWRGRQLGHLFDPATRKIYWFDPATNSVWEAPVEILEDVLSPSRGNTPPAGHLQTPIAEPSDSGPDPDRCQSRPDRRDAQQLLRSSAQIAMPDGSQCTAFKVSGDMVMTNHHCVAGMVNTAHCYPRAQSYIVTPAMRRCADLAMNGLLGRNLRKKIEVKFEINGQLVRHECDRIESAGAQLDYAVVRCPKMDPRVPNAVISEAGLRRDDPVVMATWDYGDQTGRGSIRRRLEQGRVVSTADGGKTASIGSQAGNSGSAIFNRFHEVAALNWGAEISDEAKYIRERRNGRNPRGRAQFNTLKDIMADMARRNSRTAEAIRLASRSAVCGPRTGSPSSATAQR